MNDTPDKPDLAPGVDKDDTGTWDHTVSRVMDRVAETAREEGADLRQRTHVILNTVLVVSAFLFALVLWWDVRQFSEVPFVFTPEEEMDGVLATLYLTIQGIEAYHDSAGSYQSDLESLGLDDEELAYSPRQDGYELTDAAADQSLLYRRGDDLTPYQEALNAVLLAPLEGGGS